MRHLDDIITFKTNYKYRRPYNEIRCRYSCDECGADKGYHRKNYRSGDICKPCTSKKASQVKGSAHFNFKGRGSGTTCNCGKPKTYISKTCMKCRNFRGAKNPRFKGEFSKYNITKAIRVSTKYKDFVKAIMKRDNYTCQYTGVKSGNELEVHHCKKELHEMIDEAKTLFTNKNEIINHVLNLHNDLSNGIVVTREYHMKVLHKDSYNFKYKARHRVGCDPRAIRIKATNVNTKEVLLFKSYNQTEKHFKIGVVTLKRLLKGESLQSHLRSTSIDNWEFTLG